MVDFTKFNQSIKYKNVYSQFGEDGIIERIFEKIGVTNKWCFECGAADGVFFSNTRRLVEQGWQAALVEADPKQFGRLLKLCDPDGGAVRSRMLHSPGFRYTTPQFALWHCKATPEGETSIDAILKASYAPQDIDLLVIDVDGQDYHLFNTMVEFQPRVVICEYDPNEDVDYVPTIGGEGQAGEHAIHYVARARGYQVVCKTWCNLVCVRNDLCHLLGEEVAEMPIGLNALGAMMPVKDDETADQKWERETNAFLSGARGVIHVGANTGQERDIYAGYNLPVVWIEALSSVFGQLSDNIKDYPNQRALHYLIADKDEYGYIFHIANNNGESSSLFELGAHAEIWPEVKYTDSFKWNGVTLKTALERKSINVADYDTLILDTQGAELLVLQGMGDLLDKFKYIRAETADFELYKGGCELKDLDDYLTSRGFKRAQLWKGQGKPDVGYAYEALYVRTLGALWGGFTEDDFINAKAQREKDGRFMFAVGMSTPRWGPVSTMVTIQSALNAWAVPFFSTEGAYWHHHITEAIEKGLKTHPDAILTFDYDSLFCPAPNENDIAKLITLLYEHPEVDVIAPLQLQREGGPPIANSESGDLIVTQPLSPVWFAHFGMTLFRASVFERIKKPWFWEKPDPSGSWGEGRIDPDTGFWLNCQEAGIRVCVALDVVLGHGEYGPTFPDDEFKPIRMSGNEWRKNGMKPPANAFNRQRVIEAALKGEYVGATVNGSIESQTPSEPNPKPEPDETWPYPYEPEPYPYTASE